MDQEQVDGDYFEQLWALGLGEYHKSGDIRRIRHGKIIEPDAGDYSSAGTEDDLLFAPRAITPLACTIRLRLKSFLRRFRLLGFGLVSMLSLFLWTRRNYRKQRVDSARVTELVQIALETLQEQEYNHATQSALYPEPFLATAQLRDHVLASEHSAKARKRLWSRVSKIVEENANVRTRQAQRRGEWARVWEWIGSGSAGALRPSSRPSSPHKPDMAEKDDVKPVTVSPRS
jgi:Man1-Src1p-C-terminal domain